MPLEDKIIYLIIGGLMVFCTAIIIAVPLLIIHAVDGSLLWFFRDVPAAFNASLGG